MCCGKTYRFVRGSGCVYGLSMDNPRTVHRHSRDCRESVVALSASNPSVRKELSEIFPRLGSKIIGKFADYIIQPLTRIDSTFLTGTE